MRPRRGSLGEVCEVNQGDLLFQGGGQPVASRKASTRCSEKDDTTPKKPATGILPSPRFLSNQNFDRKRALRSLRFPLAVLLISQFRALFAFCFLSCDIPIFMASAVDLILHTHCEVCDSSLCFLVFFFLCLCLLARYTASSPQEKILIGSKNAFS